MIMYLEPLVDELLKLFAYDISARPKDKFFKLHAILLWTMHDYHGYQVCSSHQISSLRGCPPCGPNVVEAYKSKALR
jgi:hypothetical protein